MLLGFRPSLCDQNHGMPVLVTDNQTHRWKFRQQMESSDVQFMLER